MNVSVAHAEKKREEKWNCVTVSIVHHVRHSKEEFKYLEVLSYLFLLLGYCMWHLCLMFLLESFVKHSHLKKT